MSSDLARSLVVAAGKAVYDEIKKHPTPPPFSGAIPGFTGATQEDVGRVAVAAVLETLASHHHEHGGNTTVVVDNDDTYVTITLHDHTGQRLGVDLTPEQACTIAAGLTARAEYLAGAPGVKEADRD